MPDLSLLPPSPDRPVLNIAGYRFVPIDDPSSLVDPLHAGATAHGLRGTVLLATEGINLFLAGAPADVRAWLDALRTDTRFADLPVQASWSAEVPFERLKVRVRREIIRMDRPAIQPASGRAPSVSPSTLARWLEAGHDDDGRDVVLLDTRNRFEVEAGTFEGALDWQLDRFGDFPSALAAHADALRDRTIVSFCTGGIRCEKAALLLREHGHAATQLDGGILRYFAETGGQAPGWTGDCIVFDGRGAVRPDLSPASTQP